MARALNSVGDHRPTDGLPVPFVLRDYAFLADGHRGVLVDPRGACTWLCFPGWADPAVFASLIGSRGHYLIQPEGRWVWGGYYEDGSLIWHSRWVTDNGIFESRDALSYPGEADRAVLLRRVRALDSPGAMRIELDARSDYGRQSLGRWRRKDGCWEAHGSELVARWWGGPEAGTVRVDREGRLGLTCDLQAGQVRDLVLELFASGAGGATEPIAPDADECWRLTEETWSTSVPDCREVIAARDIRRSYAVLRGLTSPEGGTVAAATTSLPERAQGNRNYDYRYVWVRAPAMSVEPGLRSAAAKPCLTTRCGGSRLDCRPTVTSCRRPTSLTADPFPRWRNSIFPAIPADTTSSGTASPTSSSWTPSVRHSCCLPWPIRRATRCRRMGIRPDRRRCHRAALAGT